MLDNKKLKIIAKDIRLLMLKVLRPMESHHIGCAFGIIEILTYLYFKKLNINPKNPKDLSRDIFLLSKGHAALALYATLCKKDFFNFRLLKTYDQDGSEMMEHATSHISGVELSTGSLGHALPVGIGFALGFLKDKRKNKVYVLLSDGELDEGSNWEAIMFAGHHKLNNLITIVDLNGFQGYSETKKVIDLSPIADKVKSFGWEVTECNGHDFVEISQSLYKLDKTGKNNPKMLIAKTIKGKGVSYFEGKFESHYQSIPDANTQNLLIEDFKNRNK